MKADTVALIGGLMWLISFIGVVIIPLFLTNPLIFQIIFAILGAVGLVVVGYASYLKDLERRDER